VLPNFIIVGAAKSGTTSLSSYLEAHPDVYMSPVKEPFFFSFVDEEPDFRGPYDSGLNEHIVTKLDEYEELFDGVKNESMMGECSNSYLYLSKSAERIYEYIPDCKILIVLRNPIDRAYSHYSQHRMLGHEPLSFESALQSEVQRQRDNWRWHYQYTAQGMYFAQVKEYFDVFGREQVCVCLFDDLKEDVLIFVQDICDFLGVDSAFYQDFEFEVHNRTGLPVSKLIHKFVRYPNFLKNITRPLVPKSLRAVIYRLLVQINYRTGNIPSMRSETRAYLLDLYREDIRKLQNLINRDLTSWLT
jgi:hypothetical protein